MSNIKNELQIGDIAEVYRMPDECVGIPGADANVGKKVRILADSPMSMLVFGFEEFVVEFLDEAGGSIWDWRNVEDKLPKAARQGLCPKECLRKVVEE